MYKILSNLTQGMYLTSKPYVRWVSEKAIMISRIYILSHMEAAQFDPHAIGCDPCAMIRTTSDPAFRPLKGKYESVLEIPFDDIESINDNMPVVLIKGHDQSELCLFNDTHAGLIKAYIDLHKDHASTLVVHCDAGISRSSAMAYCIAMYLELGGIAGSILSNERYHPNCHVLKLLGEKLGIRAPYKELEKRYQSLFGEDYDGRNEYGG